MSVDVLAGKSIEDPIHTIPRMFQGAKRQLVYNRIHTCQIALAPPVIVNGVALLQRQQAGSNLYDVSWVLQAVGGADAEAGIPAEQPAGDVRKAVASPGSNQASPCINQHAQAPHHASSVPAEPATNGQGRRRTRRSAGPELLGQTRGNASVSPTPAEPSHGGPVAARGRRSGGLAPAEQPLPEQPPKGCKRKSGSAADVERAKKVMAQQRRAASSSPAVVLATAGQDRKAGQGRADQQDRQGRAAPSSPALSSPGGINLQTHSITLQRLTVDTLIFVVLQYRVQHCMQTCTNACLCLLPSSRNVCIGSISQSVTCS